MERSKTIFIQREHNFYIENPMESTKKKRIELT